MEPHPRRGGDLWGAREPIDRRTASAPRGGTYRGWLPWACALLLVRCLAGPGALPLQLGAEAGDLLLGSLPGCGFLISPEIALARGNVGKPQVLALGNDAEPQGPAHQGAVRLQRDGPVAAV